MAVKIRLKRMGAKKAPFYRIVVSDSRSPRDGRFIEEIGTYDPMQEPSVVKVDAEKAKKWITGICNNNAIERSFLCTHSAQSDFYCHVDVHLQNRIISISTKSFGKITF